MGKNATEICWAKFNLNLFIGIRQGIMLYLGDLVFENI
jgi:hypothetical protein